MKYEIKHRYSGDTLYTAEIPDDTASGMQARVALEKAVSDHAGLGGAYLRGAYLRGAYLRGAYLRDADLRDADLRGAYLRGAYLRDADLGGANLGDLRSIWGTSGNLREVKALQIETWPAAYTATHMQIGCQLHPLADWWAFDDARISSMSDDALAWWKKWKPVLQQIIEMSPAVPGGEKPEPEIQ